MFYRLKISTNPPNRQTFLSIFTQNHKSQGGISFPTTHGMCDPGWNFIRNHPRNARPRVEFHSRPLTECATQGGISFPTTHGMCDPGWNSIPEHSRNARPRVEFHSRPPAEWNFEVSLIRRHIKNGGIQTFPPLSIINIQKRAENLIENSFQGLSESMPDSLAISSQSRFCRNRTNCLSSPNCWLLMPGASRE